MGERLAQFSLKGIKSGLEAIPHSLQDPAAPVLCRVSTKPLQSSPFN